MPDVHDDLLLSIPADVDLAVYLRRYDRRDFFKLTGGALLLTLLAGCGGGSNSSESSSGGSSNGATVSIHTAHGIVQLPTGYTLPLSSLSVISAAGSSPVGADGSFTLPVFGDGPSIIALINSTGEPLMLGYAPVDGTQAQISVQQTAVALTHYALGGYMFPVAVQAAFRTLIAHDASMTALTAAIEAQVVANPAVLSQSNSTLLAAVQTAVDALVPAGTLSGIAGQAARPRPMAAAHDTSATTQILVNPSPSTQQSGVAVGPNAGGTGLVVTNYDRRNLEVFIYRVGYTDSTGAVQTVGSASNPDILVQNSYLGSVNGLNGVFGSVVDALNGNVAYAPNASSPYTVPLNPANAQQTEYQVVVMGNGINVAAITSTLEADAENHMTLVTLVKEILLPLMASFLNVDYNVVSALSATNVLKAYDDLVGIVQTVINTGVNVTTSTINTAAVGVLNGLINNTTFRQNVINYFATYLLTPQTSLYSSIAKVLATDASVIVAIVDKFLGIADVTSVVYDWNNDNSRETWDIKVSLPAVHLNPPTATVNSVGNTLPFTLTTPTQGSLTYEWKTTGTYGHLTDTNGHSGTDFTSTLNAVNYVCDSLPSGTQSETDTVTCIVSLIPDTGSPQNRVTVGTANSIVTVQHSSVTFFTNRSSFLAATSNVNTIDFSTLLTGGLSEIGNITPSGLTVDGVNFVGQFADGHYETSVASGAYNSAYSGWNGDPSVLAASDNSGLHSVLTVILPTGTTAVGADLYTVQVGDGSNNTVAPVVITLATGQSDTVPTYENPILGFGGVTSNTPIVSLTFQVVASDIYANLSSFVFGTAH